MHNWLTENVGNLFHAEIANERNGGVSPSTLTSTIDSISQAPEILCEGWTAEDWVGLLMLVNLYGLNEEVKSFL